MSNNSDLALACLLYRRLDKEVTKEDQGSTDFFPAEARWRFTGIRPLEDLRGAR
jgi:hypothetical protein